MAEETQIFQRIEIKYLLNEEQYVQLREAILPYLTEDTYGDTEVCNCYYDTDSYQMIRRSLEKPVYKEKLRLRSYGTPKDKDAFVYMELKKKYKGIVYKRREQLSLGEAEGYLNQNRHPDRDSQILREINWVLQYYQTLKPVMYLGYHRIALCERGVSTGLRVTFDREILWRTDAVALQAGNYGTPLLQPGEHLMEIKVPVIREWRQVLTVRPNSIAGYIIRQNCRMQIPRLPSMMQTVRRSFPGRCQRNSTVS